MSIPNFHSREYREQRDTELRPRYEAALKAGKSWKELAAETGHDQGTLRSFSCRYGLAPLARTKGGNPVSHDRIEKRKGRAA